MFLSVTATITYIQYNTGHCIRSAFIRWRQLDCILHYFKHLNAELNPICHLLALLEAHHILHVSTIRVKAL